MGYHNYYKATYTRKYDCFGRAGFDRGWLILGWMAMIAAVVAAHPSSAPPAEPPRLTCGNACGYDDWFDRAHCNNRNLSVVPIVDGCDAVQVLEVQGNHISRISSDCLEGYRYVTSLDASENVIAVIEPGAFAGLPEMEHLLLFQNEITALENDTFMGTIMLSSINLNQNKIVEISENVLWGLTELTSIFLSNNRISHLARNIFQGLFKLKDLSISNNKLVEIEEDLFKGLIRVSSIYLNDNRLVNIPSGLFNGLTALQSVYLSNNRLISIPAPTQLGLTSGLIVIVLQDNDITEASDIIPYMDLSESVFFGGNPFRCGCDFATVQELYFNNSLHEQPGYNQAIQVTCISGERSFPIDQPLPVEFCPENGEMKDEVPVTSTIIVPESSGIFVQTSSESYDNVTSDNSADPCICKCPCDTSDVQVSITFSDWLVIYIASIVTLHVIWQLGKKVRCLYNSSKAGVP
ncbi:uncharacterized protein [Apostichopus japonicus]|uniref:uncharacterized protein isoform X2 n=1 Tax=Stichopus japonicus TaxID=307972 RepID=UPI003AB6E35C